MGAGIAGLASAWRAAQAGLRVVVLERGSPGAGASSVAAGMLAPVTEAEFGEDELLGLNLESAALWPSFAAELEASTGLPTGYRAGGALAVAVDRDDAEELRRLHRLQRSLGLESEWLVPSAARAAEPGLAPRIAGAIDAPGDAQVDPVAVIEALLAAVADAGVEIRSGAAVRRDPGADTLSFGDERIRADQIVIAAGAWSAELADVRVHPVKGQLLHLRTRAGAPPLAGRIVRTPRCYVVPRADGRVVVGATTEEKGFDTSVDAGAVHRLLEAAWEVLPDVWELEFVGVIAGLRPATPDNRPLIGRASERLIYATGHYRNGILLAPLTAQRVAGELTRVTA
ncbi:MAG TPA: glycine oxidase ThiO [Thermoleophilaceae bacterium]|nr:glycine oxidase ThiO [Thermoleophilaceae bacterium]